MGFGGQTADGAVGERNPAAAAYPSRSSLVSVICPSSLSGGFGWTVMLRRGAARHLEFETLRAFGAQGDTRLRKCFLMTFTLSF